MSLIKIYSGGTRSDGKIPLCNTCTYGQVMKGAAESNEVIYCNNISEYIRTRIVQCSGYKNKSLTPIYEMKEIAWVLSTNKAKTKIGFQKYSAWRKDNEGTELIPGEYD